MKRKLFIFVLLLFAVCPLVAQDFEQSENIYRMMREHKGDSVVRHFDLQMKAAVSASQAGSILDDMAAYFGALKGEEGWQRIFSAVGFIDHRHVNYERAVLDLQLSYNTNGEICGLFLKPVPGAAPSQQAQAQAAPEATLPEEEPVAVADSTAAPSEEIIFDEPVALVEESADDEAPDVAETPASTESAVVPAIPLKPATKATPPRPRRSSASPTRASAVPIVEKRVEAEEEVVPPVPAVSFPTRPIEIHTGDVVLPGKLTLPSEEGRGYPVAILVGGSGPTDMDGNVGPTPFLADLADSLAAHGIASIRYDKRTRVYGLRTSEVSGGSLDYDTEVVDDAISALAVASNLPEADPERIFVVGHSLGAWLAPRIVQRSVVKVAGLVGLAMPGRKLQTLLHDQLAYLGEKQGLSAEAVKQQEDAMLAQLPPEYIKMDNSYNAPEVASKLKQPQLYMLGQSDYQVTMADQKVWLHTNFYHENGYITIHYYLNHLMAYSSFMAKPEDYAKRQYIEPFVVEEVSTFINEGGKLPHAHIFFMQGGH